MRSVPSCPTPASTRRGRAPAGACAPRPSRTWSRSPTAGRRPTRSAFGTDGPATVVTFQAAPDEYEALRAAGPPYHHPPWRPGIVGVVRRRSHRLDRARRARRRQLPRMWRTDSTEGRSRDATSARRCGRRCGAAPSRRARPAARRTARRGRRRAGPRREPTSSRTRSCSAQRVAPGREVGAGRGLDRERVVDVGEAHADEREVPEQDRARDHALVLGFDARREPGEHVPAVERHAAERAGRDVAADGVERDVDAAAAGRLERRVDEVGRRWCRRRRRRRARGAEVRLLGRSRQRDHAARRPCTPSWTAADPTPPAAAWTSTVSPALHAGRARRATSAREVERHEDRGGVGQRDRSGIGNVIDAGATAYSA